MSWPMHNTGQQWNPGMMMGPDMNIGSYTPEQWAVIQQQNWQQWSQWQQQYAQWQSQYGEKYAEQIQAIQAMGSLPPLPPSNPIAPPAPPPPEKPPPPPHENNQPLYAHTPSQPAPVPAPNLVQKQNVNSGNAIPTISQTDNNFNRSNPPASNSSSVNAEALKNLAEEERLFDIQFQKWEEEIEKWKKENANHPDKETYKQYEQRFEACRAQLLVRRQQMDKKKARLLETGPPPLPPQADSTTVASNVNPAPTIPLQNSPVHHFSNKPQKSFENNAIENPNKITPHFGNNTSQNYLPHSNQYQKHNLSQNQNTYNRANTVSIEAERKYQYSNTDEYSKETYTVPLNNPSFLLASESNKKDIPGLDLIPESEKSAMSSKLDANVIDITDDNPSRGPDYTIISKGINNILGDEKIMNILSMVRGQVPPASSNNTPPVQQIQSGHYTANTQSNPLYEPGGNNQNYGNQQFDNRQNNSSARPFQIHPNHQRHPNPQGTMPPNQQGLMHPNQQGLMHPNQQGLMHPNQQGLMHPNQQRLMHPNPQGLMHPNQHGSRQFKAEELQNDIVQHQYDDCNESVQYGGNNRGQSFDEGYAPSRLNMTGPRAPNRPPFQDMPTQNDYSRNVASAQQNNNEFSRGASDHQQNSTDYPKRPLSLAPQNDFARGPTGGDKQLVHDFPRGPPGPVGPMDRRPLLHNNIDTVASEPVGPKWACEPMFSPSIIVEYEHMPLRLKARDFMEPVHIFEYNHKSKEDDKKKDFEIEEEIFKRKPRRPEILHDYGMDRYNRDYRSRDFERRAPREDLDEIRIRGPPREDYEDRRRPDEDRKKLEDDRRRIDSRFDDRRRDDRDKFIRRDDMYREYDRDFHRDRDRGRDSRRDEARKEDSRKDEGRRDDHRRDDSRLRSRSRDRESRKRALSRDSDTSSKKSKDVTVPAKVFDQPKHIVMIDDLLEMPGREMRPEKIVIILRGPPGSGKSYLAKLIRDKEAEYGGTVRIMSIDDYFMQEGEIEEIDPATGKMIKKPTLKYEYDEHSEEAYLSSLKRAFKRCLTDGYFTFVIYDAINDTVKSYADVWSYARQNDFQAYVCSMESDPQLCYKRNIHNRTLSDIEVISARFFATPAHHIQLDATTLLQSAAITEVHMEDADDEIIMEDAQEPEVESVFTSKWEIMDDAAQLARLDGTSKPLRPSQLSMEDYLQLDDWKPTTAKPGKKTVRWADIEERRQQEKMRAIGFVVGQTDWMRMTDPTMGSSALTQTKYIERVRRY